MASRVRSLFFRVPFFVSLLLALPFIAHLALMASEKAGFTPHDLAYYLDESQINFVRPGLKIRIQSVTVENQRFVARFRLADPRDLPLDRSGVFTPGSISTSFIAAYIPRDQSQYTAYTTRTRISPVNNQSVLQATSDSGGTYAAIADGEYTYTFRTTVPVEFDRTATHTIGVFAVRDLREFELGSQVANDTFDFVPDGSPVRVVRDVVRTETCNKCHDPLAAHTGGARQSVRLCILCHQPQSTDDQTLNPIDFKVMIHKIHRGSDLPSVRAGKPYMIEHDDFSTVAFPDRVERCEVCHTGGAQSNHYLTNPSRAACGSCHDDVNFATGEGHVDQPQVSDNMCSTCHIPQGEREFDASIRGAHTVATLSRQLPGTTFSIVRVENTSLGQRPRVTFTIKDREGNVIDAASMNSLSLFLAGPTSDYNGFPAIREDARGATRSGNEFVYTFTAAVPADAVGTYTVSIEGYRNITLNQGTRQEMTARDAGFNRLSYFSVGSGPAVPRRQVVSIDKCNVCHGTLALHGGSRRNTDHCVLCHNPNATDTGRRTAANLPGESIHFKNMIHKIHSGENLESDYTVWGGSAHNYNEVRFPGDRRNCEKCHLPGTYELPIGDGLLPTQTPRGYFPVTQPIAAACLSCHTTKYAAAHAAVMTSPVLGESCSACHGRNADLSVARVHAR
jgi:OmcA/MtrC family decaheme c-type cytochrome